MKTLRGPLALSTLLLALELPSAASAQDAPTEPPAPPYATPASQPIQPSYVPRGGAPSAPRVITDWEEGEPIPPGYHRSTQVRKGPVIAGSILFGVFYLFSTLGAAVGADSNQGSSNPEAPLWLPGIGPFITMANTSSSVGNWVLGVDGFAQTAGLALLIYGIASPREVLVRDSLLLRVVPRPMLLGCGGGGLGLMGAF